MGQKLKTFGDIEIKRNKVYYNKTPFSKKM